MGHICQVKKIIYSNTYKKKRPETKIKKAMEGS